MMPTNPKRFYSRFLEGHKGKLHFAAHSHHFWPDVTREAQLAYWDHAALTSDEKWGKIFSEVIPEAQKNVASLLNLKDPGQIVFAPNTHELSARILSLFAGKKELRILTTSSEFHSWRRQLLRLQELPQVKVDFVSTDSLLSHRESFLGEIKDKLKKAPDLFFISQVFFDSGLALTSEELLDLQKATSPQTLMVIDGYHGFAALPTDLGPLEGKVFYLGGGYKYAQAGEGAAFLVLPKGNWRPLYTGWFAEFGELNHPPGKKVGYTSDAQAFIGSTQDPSGLYRFNAVWKLFKEESLSIPAIHTWVRNLQIAFIQGLSFEFLNGWKLKALYQEDLSWHGHFLTFEAESLEEAQALENTLKKSHILIDRRGSRVRFGFGLYQDLKDVENLLGQLRNLASPR